MWPAVPSRAHHESDYFRIGTDIKSAAKDSSESTPKSKAKTVLDFNFCTHLSGISGVFALVWSQKGLRHRLVDLGRKRLCITAVYIINIFGSNIEQQFHRV